MATTTNNSITIGETTIDLKASVEDGSHVAAGVTVETVTATTTAAIATARGVRTDLGKVKGKIRELAQAKANVAGLYVTKDGYPCFNFAKLPDTAKATWTAVMDTAFAPSAKASDKDKRTLAEDRQDAENAIRVEMSRRLTETLIVNYALGLTKVERGSLQWNDGGMLACKADNVAELLPAELLSTIVETYKRDELAVPLKFGGTKKLGSGGGRGHEAKTVLTDLSQIRESVSGGGLAPLAATEATHTLAMALWARISEGEQNYGADREAIEDLANEISEVTAGIALFVNGTMTDKQRAATDKIANPVQETIAA